MKDNGHAGPGGHMNGDGYRPQPFTVEMFPDRDRVFVVPRGELDLATVGLVSDEVDDLTARGFDRIVIDLRETSFIDSSGVRMVVQCAQRADAHVTVIDGPPAVGRVFDLAGVRALLAFEAVS